tara:strand:- start:403 stop:1305 length:903 start_codon:yes stop_codon:yes gene_type:complete
MKMPSAGKIKLKFFIIYGLAFFFISSVTSFSADFVISQPPKSMDKYYSDSGMPSEWIKQMQKLSIAFSALVLNMGKNRWDLAEKQAILFLKSYEKASKMVPEWEKEFDLKSATKLKESIEIKDLKNFETLTKILEETCSNCHLKNSSSVWIRYHWPSTGTIKVLDPIEDKEVSYPDYMKKLSQSLQRVTVSFEEKDFQQAWQKLDIFTKRFTNLRSVCSKCHVSEWTKSSASVKDFFVGEDMIYSLHKIKKNFASGEPSEKIFRKNINYIYNRSCKICHLVHQPAAFIQQTWKQQQNFKK